MKKLVPVVITLFVFMSSFISSYAINVSIDDQNVQFSETSGSPFIDQSSRTQVPFRQTMEAFGCEVSWDAVNKIAIAKKDGVTVRVPIGEASIAKNDQQIKNDTAALIKDNRTYLPIRAVLEAFGANVSWDSATQTVVVLSTNKADSNQIQEIKVSTAEEFVKAIGSNRKIILESGEYDLSK